MNISKHERSSAVLQAAQSAKFNTPLETPADYLLEAGAAIRQRCEGYRDAANLDRLQSEVEVKSGFAAVELPQANDAARD